MPSLTNMLVGVGPICDADYTVVFTKQYVTVLSQEGETILTGWRVKKLPRLWRFDLKPTEYLIKNHTTTMPKTTAAHSAYNLPRVEALVRYMHTIARFPVKPTRIRAIKKGKFATCPGLTYCNTENYCPQEVETIKGRMVQSSQGVWSTKKKTYPFRCIKKEPAKSTLEKEYEREDIPPPLKTK